MQEYCIKSVFTGNCNVGKSSIITQYADNLFDDFIKSTIGIDFRLKTICYNNVKIKLQLWDTAGHEKYQSLTNTYYRGIYLFFIVFDITDRESFDNLSNWLDRIDAQSDVVRRLILVGNRIDLSNERKISKDEALLFAKNNNMEYYEVSAKNDTNIDKMFNTIIENIIDNIDKIRFGNGIIDRSKSNNIQLISNSTRIKDKCKDIKCCGL